MEKLLVLDGNSIINRAFYAIKNLTTRDGIWTNGIYGFLNIFLKTMEEEKPQYVVVAFDVREPTFRHKEYELYKAQRKGMPPELAEQMPLLKELLTLMNVAQIEKAGYEADDLIGTISNICTKQGVQCCILTGDRDDIQLINENVNVLLTTTAMGFTQTVRYDTQAVKEKYGITPKMMIEVKGLMGDSSDNIPGVAGVGEKTALSLIAKYKTIEGVYENLSEIKGVLNKKLEEGREQAFLSRRLSTIVLDVPIDKKIDDFAVLPYNDGLAGMLEKLEFNSLINKLDLKAEKAESLTAEVTKADENIISKIDKLFYLLNEDKILFAFSDKVYEADAIDMKDVFEDASIPKTANNIKVDIKALNKMGIGYEGIAFDTAIATYILNPAENNFSLSHICSLYMGADADDAGQASCIEKLAEIQRDELQKKGQEQLYFDIELPLIPVLASMEILGFRADKEKLIEFSKLLKTQIDALEADIYEMAGESFNINSPKQLGVILFEKLQLPVIKKTKTGYSTGVDVLEKLRPRHAIIDSILKYRHFAKLKSTYADGLANVINPETGRIHSSFNQTVTTTGRISSTEPNLQNIPIRTEIGREFRKVFVAENDDYILVDADYSQIELRVLASISGDERMCDSFRGGIDIHTKTASQVFGLPHDMITPEMRRKAKAVNFGIVYGIGEFSLSEDIGVSRKEAKEYIEKYLDSYVSVRQYMKDTVTFAKEHGFVKTLSGRRRYIPEITSSNFNLRSFGERVAMNAPIQGTAADIIKLAMIHVYNALKKEAPKSRLILQVHDELIVEAHKDEVNCVKEIVKREMENAFSLSVPIDVDMASGRSWFDAK